MTLNEMAPPGREDQVKALKKKFPHDDEAPYKIAWAQHNRKKKKNVKEAVATAAATSPFWGPKALGLTMTGIGALGTYLQSRKKKEKKSDSSLLDAVRKKQAEIQQDVANQETLKQNEKNTKKDEERGKYLPRKRKPENEFYGESAVAVATSPLWLPKVLVATGAAGTLAQTIFKSDWYQRAKERAALRKAEREASTNKSTPKDKKNKEAYNQRLKDEGLIGKGSKKGGKWDSLPKGNQVDMRKNKKAK